MRAFKNVEKKIDTSVVITQPDMSFTPRQILEQFARNEVVPSFYSPSDNIDDSNFSEDEMCNNVIEFEDKIDAENHLLENQYAIQLEKDKGKPASDKGSEKGTDKTEHGTESESKSESKSEPKSESGANG